MSACPAPVHCGNTVPAGPCCARHLASPGTVIHPDGLEFEVVWLIPAHLLTDADRARGGGRPLPLDLPREKDRFGGDTRGGLGISVPLGVGR